MELCLIQIVFFICWERTLEKSALFELLFSGVKYGTKWQGSMPEMMNTGPADTEPNEVRDGELLSLSWAWGLRAYEHAGFYDRQWLLNLNVGRK